MKNSVVLIVLLSLAFVSCKKKGCTDITADNYQSSATADDGSCTYSGSTVFWFDDTTASNLFGASLLTVDLYIDNVNSGSLNWNQYTSAAPVCGISGYTEVTDLVNSASMELTYHVRTQPDPVSGLTTVLDSGFVITERGTCNSVEFNF